MAGKKLPYDHPLEKLAGVGGVEVCKPQAAVLSRVSCTCDQ